MCRWHYIPEPIRIILTKYYNYFFFFLLSGHLFVEDICVYDNHHALILSMKNTVYMYFSTTKRNVKPVYPNNIAVDHTLWSSSNRWHNDCEISILFWNVWCSVYKLSNIHVYAVIPKKKMAIQTTIFFCKS